MSSSAPAVAAPSASASAAAGGIPVALVGSATPGEAYNSSSVPQWPSSSLGGEPYGGTAEDPEYFYAAKLLDTDTVCGASDATVMVSCCPRAIGVPSPENDDFGSNCRLHGDGDAVSAWFANCTAALAKEHAVADLQTQCWPWAEFRHARAAQTEAKLDTMATEDEVYCAAISPPGPLNTATEQCCYSAGGSVGQDKAMCGGITEADNIDVFLACANSRSAGVCAVSKYEQKHPPDDAGARANAAGGAGAALLAAAGISLALLA